MRQPEALDEDDDTAVRPRSAWAAALLILVWFLATAGLRPLANPDEGRYVGIAWEMMHAHDWLTPTLDGLPYFHKPPLFYWLTAAAMSVFGPTDLAARVAPIAGAWLGTSVFHLFCRRWCGRRIARWATVAVATLPLTYLGAQYANMDMLVAGLIAASVLLLADAALRQEAGEPHRLSLVSGYAAAAFGVLAKGLIGAALPLFVIVAWLLATRRARRIAPMVSVTGLVVFFAITLPWFIALQRRFPGFLDYFFIVQQVQRFAETGFNNVRPFWFYPALLALASLPWLPWLAPLLRRRQGYLSDPRLGPIRWLMLLWMAVVTLFFSIPQSKLPGYILPAVPPLGFFVADALKLLLRDRPAAAFALPRSSAKRLWLTSAGVGLVFALAVVIGVTLRPPNSTRDLAEALARARTPGEPVFMLETYYFDLPFYARLTAPVAVVDAWDTPEVRAHDNWRKEMADAGDFAPGLAARSLVTPAQLPARACAAATSWFVAPNDARARYPVLALAEVIRAGSRATLWKLDRRRPAVGAALGCAPMPAGGPGDPPLIPAGTTAPS